MQKGLLVGATLAVGCSFTADFDGYTFRASDGGVDSAIDAPGDAGVDAPRDETPPTVVSTSPAADTNLLDGRASIFVVFSEPIRADSSDVRVVLDDAVDVPGSVEVDNETLRFTPETPLRDGEHRVTVDATVTDTSGNALAEPFTFAFTTQPGATLISFREEAAIGELRCPELAADNAGNVAMIFMEDRTLYFALYRAGIGWSEASALAEEAQDANLSISPGGRIAVAYTAEVSDVARPLVRVSEAPLSTEFDMPSLADEVEPAIDPIHPPTPGSCSLRDRSMGVAVNDAGAVAVMWRTQGPVLREEFGWARNVRAADGTWNTTAETTTLSPVDSAVRFRPAIAMNSAGHVESVHFGRNGLSDTIFIRRSYDGSDWISPDPDNFLAGSSLPPRVSLLADDRFLFVMSGFDEGRFTLTSHTGNSEAPLVEQTVVNSQANEMAFSNGPVQWLVWQVAEDTIFAFRETLGDWRSGIDIPRDIPSEAQNFVIAGLSPPGDNATALTLYEEDNAIWWAELEDEPVVPGVRRMGRLYEGGGEIVREPRVVFDSASNHGVIAFVGQNGGILRVANFRGALNEVLTP
ncbi:MAG: Ig-like domain-containing protein [Myxococcota bacterium]